MSDRKVNGDCSECESTFEVEYTEEMVSEQLPEFCPFCGSSVVELSESYIEDDDSTDEEEWE
jgi:hypothetical protein